MQRIRNRKLLPVWGVLLLALLVRGEAQAQKIEGLPSASAKSHLSYIAEPIEIMAGRQAMVELRFKVESGFHVNSHTPKDELLIPTALKLEGPAGTKVLTAEYPPGVAFRLAIGDGETLDVYQGVFRVRVGVLVPKGQTTLTGGLRYQACDSVACFPPRTLELSVPVTGK